MSDKITVFWDYKVEDLSFMNMGKEVSVTFYPEKHKEDLNEYSISFKSLDDYLFELAQYIEDDTEENLNLFEKADEDDWEFYVLPKLQNCKNIAKHLCDFINSDNCDFEPLVGDVWKSACADAERKHDNSLRQE